MTAKASGKLTPDGFTGGTLTISNLGMYGVGSRSGLELVFLADGPQGWRRGCVGTAGPDLGRGTDTPP